MSTGGSIYVSGVVAIDQLQTGAFERRPMAPDQPGIMGVEGGLHQRLDVSTNEDQCRVGNRNGVWVLGMFRRLAISLFAEWHSRDTKRKRATMTDFQADLSAEHASYAMRFIAIRYPTLRKRS